MFEVAIELRVWKAIFAVLNGYISSNLKDMRRHLNNDCSKVIRSKFMSDKVCEARVLDNLEAMVEEHVSSKASLMLKKLGKILFPMPANDYLHTGDGHVMWTKCNDRYV